jgi:hypothetical protein
VSVDQIILWCIVGSRTNSPRRGPGLTVTMSLKAGTPSFPMIDAGFPEQALYRPVFSSELEVLSDNFQIRL